MGAIVIRTRYNEGTESAEVATSEESPTRRNFGWFRPFIIERSGLTRGLPIEESPRESYKNNTQYSGYYGKLIYEIVINSVILDNIRETNTKHINMAVIGHILIYVII